MEEKKITKILIDKESGEYLQEIYEDETIKITSQKQENAIFKSYKNINDNKETTLWGKSLGGFVFVLFKYCNNLEQHIEISPEDMTKLFYLATYVNYQGYLIYDNAYMTRKEMDTVLRLHISTFDLFFNRMKNLNIFIFEDNTKIKLNKDYFIKGEIENEMQQYSNYTRIYIHSIRYLYENVSSRNHRQLGIYYRLIPYVHRQNNVVCYNPDSNKNEMNMMTLRELRNKLGYTKRGLRPFINDLLGTKLENGDSIVALFVRDPNFWESVIIVNPKVVYGGNNIKELKESYIRLFSGGTNNARYLSD